MVASPARKPKKHVVYAANTAMDDACLLATPSERASTAMPTPESTTWLVRVPRTSGSAVRPSPGPRKRARVEACSRSHCDRTRREGPGGSEHSTNSANVESAADAPSASKVRTHPVRGASHGGRH